MLCTNTELFRKLITLIMSGERLLLLLYIFTLFALYVTNGLTRMGGGPYEYEFRSRETFLFYFTRFLECVLSKNEIISNKSVENEFREREQTKMIAWPLEPE